MDAPLTPPTPPLLRAEGVWMRYRMGEVTVEALRGVDLGIAAGDFVVLLGASGSGKTTLLNVLGGMETPSQGRVLFRDSDLGALDDRGLTDYRRDQVGFVFQFFNLVPTLTALENVQLAVEAGGAGGGGEVARGMLSAVGLAGREDSFPAELSGGEQQRVAIARALVKAGGEAPPLLLCDEATGNLDAETGRGVLELLRQLQRRYANTVIFVTHNARIAEMADRVVRLHSGRIAEDFRNPHPRPPGEVDW